MAMDGFGVLTRAPYETEVVWPKYYCYRKKDFAIVVLAGCDANARFISATCDHSGSTNDIIAWQDCNLYQMLEEEKLLSDKYFLLVTKPSRILINF